jgi:hypothetical protein
VSYKLKKECADVLLIDIAIASVVLPNAALFLADVRGICPSFPSTYDSENAPGSEVDLPLSELVPFFFRMCWVRGDGLGVW